MKHPSHYDPEKLRELFFEMTKTVDIVTKSSWLRGVLGAALETDTVDETIAHLRHFNRKREKDKAGK